MPSDDHFRKLERMYLGAPTNVYYQPEIRIEVGTAEVRFPLREDFFHSAGAVHGSIYFKALDDAAFFAAHSLVDELFLLTVSFTVYMTRPVSSGEIRAAGRVVHRSPRLYLAEAELTNSRGVEIGRGSGTFMPSKIRLGPEVGYA